MARGEHVLGEVAAGIDVGEILDKLTTAIDLLNTYGPPAAPAILVLLERVSEILRAV